MKLIAGGGVNTLDIRYRVDPNRPGIVIVTIKGLVTDAALPAFWAALESPVGAASLVSVFDFRGAVLAYRNPPRLVPGAPQQKAGVFLSSTGQYEILLRRAAQLNELGVRRGVFCSMGLALEWAGDEVRLALAKSAPYMRARL